MHHRKLLSLLRQILECPTAPFHEYHVAAKIRELLAPLPHVTVEADAFGNLIACYRLGRTRPRLAFGAHMDHPGWVRGPAKSGAAEFLGGFPKEHLDPGRVAWFGEFGMWKLPAFELDQGRIRSRACDDLIGCAVMVAMLVELERQSIEATCHCLFTRAEEVGFIGAIELAKNWPLPDSVRFVSLETSAPRGGAEIGAGPAIRVGDRTSVFDDGVIAELLDAADRLKIPVQRRLLDGGSCEATAMQLYGIPSAGISVLLDGYHNYHPRRKNPIGVESVSLADVKSLIKLVTGTVRRMAEAGPGQPAKKALRKGLEERARQHRTHERSAKKAWGKV